MRLDPPLEVGVLRARYKRFLADIETPGGVITAHCPNTGAMTGCAEPGATVWYSTSDNPARKYAQTLEVVETDLGRVGVNTARANRLVEEALLAGAIEEIGAFTDLRREAKIPGEKGRFDFLLEAPDTPACHVEVKSLTLAYPGGRGAFPDAVSERAVRHLAALTTRVEAGERAVLLFCVQHTGVSVATPADEIHPAYGEALRDAADKGVEVLARACRIERDEIRLDQALEVDLSRAEGSS